MGKKDLRIAELELALKKTAEKVISLESENEALKSMVDCDVSGEKRSSTNIIDEVASYSWKSNDTLNTPEGSLYSSDKNSKID